MVDDHLASHNNPGFRLGLIRILGQPTWPFLLGLALLFATARDGPDYNKYVDWSRVLSLRDLSAFPTRIGVQQTVPGTQWLAGPGLFLGLPCIVSGGAVSPETGAALMSWLAVAAFWLTWAGVLHEVTGRRRWLLWIGIAFTFVGTPAGYYCVAHSTECLTLMAGAMLAKEMVGPRKSPWLSAVGVGSAVALLLMVRPYLSLYGLPACVALWYRTRAARGRRAAWFVIPLAAAPVMAGLWQLAAVNDWMTGEPTRFVYSFGDDGFRSVDWGHPELAAVLFHPLHGLFVYHPGLLLGAGCMLWLSFRAERLAERLVWGSLLVIVGVNACVQAAWYQWWLALRATFGMRGMVLAAVPAVAAVVRVMAQASRVPPGGVRPAGSGAWLKWTVGVCGVWSWLLLLQGPSDYVDWGALAWAQVVSATRVLHPVGLLAAIVTGAPLAVFLRQWAGREEHADLQDRAGVTCGVVLLLLAFFYLWSQALPGPWSKTLGDGNPDPLWRFDPWIRWHWAANPWVLPAAVLGAFVLQAVGRRVRFLTRLPLSRLGDAGVLGTNLTVWAMLLCFFLAVPQLAAQAAARAAAGQRAPAATLYYVPEVVSAHDQYRSIPGFSPAKARLQGFLEREGLVQEHDGK